MSRLISEDNKQRVFSIGSTVYATNKATGDTRKLEGRPKRYPPRVRLRKYKTTIVAGLASLLTAVAIMAVYDLA